MAPRSKFWQLQGDVSWILKLLFLGSPVVASMSVTVFPTVFRMAEVTYLGHEKNCRNLVKRYSETSIAADIFAETDWKTIWTP